MKTAASLLRLIVPVWALLSGALPALADPNVAVIAHAREDYTEQKFAGGKAAVETYVFMEGSYFEGTTVDHSIERMPFRRIAEYLGTELARQNYLPAQSINDAQLLLVVHWGTTTPRVSVQESFGGTNLSSPVTGAADIAAFAKEHPDGTFAGGLPPAPDTTQTPEANDLAGVVDRLIGNVSVGNSAALLGYQEEIHKLSKAYSQTQSDIINFHLTSERYFITIMAYEVKQLRENNSRHRPVWSLHLNISSPGNNFSTALDRISIAAAEYAGRSTDGLQTVRPTVHEGKVNLAPLVIIGEVKEPSKR